MRLVALREPTSLVPRTILRTENGTFELAVTTTGIGACLSSARAGTTKRVPAMLLHGNRGASGLPAASLGTKLVAAIPVGAGEAAWVASAAATIVRSKSLVVMS